MEKKNKKSIVIGITSLLIVTLLLLGLTYAYYRTRIIGNPNEESISVTSKNLEIKYLDGTAYFIPGRTGVSEEDTDGERTGIEPGDKFIKEFSVENTGDEEVEYAVILEEVVNQFTRTNEDMKITLTCTSSVGDCNGLGENNFVSYPLTNEVLMTNTIASKEIQTYQFTLEYINHTNIDQSIDMEAKIEGKFNIIDTVNTVDIEGYLANAEEGDYVQINSETKISQIVNGKYKLVGVEPGSHTLTIRYKDENGVEQIRARQAIEIAIGDSYGVSGNTITINNYARTATINVLEDNTFSILSEIRGFAPIGKTLLADVVSVGDYVKYSYTASDYTVSNVGWIEDQTFSSKSGGNVEIGETTTHTNYTVPSWRVLSVENGIIKLISSEAIDASLNLSGKSGYINGPSELNAMCQALYSGKYGEARSLTREDIVEAIVKDGAVINEAVQYIGSDGRRYNIIEKLIEAGVTEQEISELGDEITIAEFESFRTKLPATSEISNVQTPDGTNINNYILSSYEAINNTNYKDSAGNTITDLRNNPTYSMIFLGTKSSSSSSTSRNVSYWVNYSGVLGNYNESVEGKTFYDFNVGFVHSGSLSATSLFESDGTLKGLEAKPKEYGIRPVVVLNTNLTVDTSKSTETNLDPSYGNRYYNVWNIEN